MKVSFGPKGKIYLDDVKILWSNFAGARDNFGNEGKRDFTIEIDDPEIAEQLRERGCNVTISVPKDPRYEPKTILKIKVSYQFDAPEITVKSGNNFRSLNEGNVGNLDKIYMEQVDIDISLGKEWERGGKTARTAYLDKMFVVQEVSRFRARFAEEEWPEE